MVSELQAVIRIGFVFTFDDGWLGGINYFRNLLTALYALPDRQVEAVVFTGLEPQDKHLDGFPDIKVVRSRIFDRGTLPWLARKLWLRCFSHDLFLERLLRKQGVAVLSHSGWLGKDASIPAIGWIPDFQHVHLPDCFNLEEIKSRDREFHQLCKNCSKVIVSSYDAQSDLLEFDPDCQSKSEVLQFVASSRRVGETLPNRGELEQRYKFFGNYFLLPNQFWKHKNHRVVIEALGLLRRKNKMVLVLATGSASDYRHPEYFESLMERVHQLGIEGNFIHLGLVPASDLAGLLRDAIAIVNPSLFEGWSTTVEEARLLGKPVLLSDIPVHREQNPPQASYFHPDDAQALATLLWNIWDTPVTKESNSIEMAHRSTDELRLAFARKYQEIVLCTLQHPAR